MSGAADRAREQLALAADLPLAEAQALFARVSAQFGFVKVGLSLFVEHGPLAVRTFTEQGAKVFLDLKLHDIPNTVKLAAARAAGLGVSLLTVHASGGEPMLRAAIEGAREGADRAGVLPPKILAVTVLTSLRQEDLEQVGLAGTAQTAGLKLAQLAARAGVDGAVCSPREAKVLRQSLGPAFFLCTPGIRAQGAAKDEQTRAETAADALAAGSNLLVIGRPVYAAADPLAAARAFHLEVSRI